MKIIDKHHRAAEMMVWGWSYPRIASELQCSPETVRKWNNEVEYQAVVQEVRAKITEDCRDLTVAARRMGLTALMETVRDLPKDSELRMKCAEILLNRTGDDVKSGHGQDATLAQTLAYIASQTKST